MKLGGLETEDEYSYEGRDDKCKFNRSEVAVKINGAVNISSDENEIKAWLYKNGPISVGINAFAMQFYWGGISHPWKIFCDPSELDHGVLIVGYGVKDGEPYWIIKNSWGEDWGEKSVEEEDSGDHPPFTDKKYTPAQRVQQLLMLNHKLRMKIRLLHAAQQEHATLTHKIHNATYGVTLSPGMNHLTTMQTHMLRHPQEMKKVLTLLEADSSRLENLLQWEDKEIVFWEWMDSVLDLKVQGRVDGGDSFSSDAEGAEMGACAARTVYLDVPPSMGADIAASRRNLMNMILQFESAIEKLEELWETKINRILNEEVPQGIDFILTKEVTQETIPLLY
nr:hypothetical protein BaRGS_007506 [Batillaria attramentaria]